ncbi:MAG: SAM domain-containing protein [Chthoniobacteraceae bacterium]
MSRIPDMDSNNPSPADAEELSRWLRIRGFGQYVGRFAERSISFKDLAHLTEDDLKRLGVGTIVHRVVLLSEIALLKDGNSGVSQVTAAGAVAAFPKGAASFPGMSKPSAIPPPGRVVAPAVPAQVAAGGTTAQAALPPLRKTLKERFGGRFLIISILAHILFGVGATYYVVQTIAAKRKLTFHGGPPSPNPSQRAIEHKVQMAKKQNTMSAPVPSKRVVTTGLSKIALPEMPAMPDMNNAASTKMIGTGGLGVGMAPSIGVMGSSDGTGGGTVPFFGFRTGNGFKGSFYDLKQTSGRGPTPINNIEKFVHELDRFLQGGWNESFLDRYFKAPAPLYATQIFVPVLDSVNAPKAFGVEKDVKPALWIALYKVKISPPETGVYHFVGGGDNILIVRLDGKTVLDRSWDYQEKFGIDKTWKPVANYDYKFPNSPSIQKVPRGFAKGSAMALSSASFYDMEVLLGDDGGITHFSLLVEEEGVQYQKNAQGLPILPIFRLTSDAPPPGEHPPYMDNGPVWKWRPSSVSIFSH